MNRLLSLATNNKIDKIILAAITIQLYLPKLNEVSLKDFKTQTRGTATNRTL
jgi:hypothetical protein